MVPFEDDITFDHVFDPWPTAVGGPWVREPDDDYQDDTCHDCDGPLYAHEGVFCADCIDVDVEEDE